MTTPPVTLAVFGASGASGQAIVAEAGRRGWPVRAMLRPGSAWLPPAGVTVIRGQLDEAPLVEAVVRGATVVVCVFGPRPPFRDVFCARATATVLAAMQRTGVTRLVCQTGAMVAPDPVHVGPGLRLMAWAFRRQRPAVAADRVEQERLVRESSTRWTLIKPPRLAARPASGRYEAGADVKVGLRSSTAFDNLAALVADCIQLDRHVGASIYVRDAF